LTSVSETVKTLPQARGQATLRGIGLIALGAFCFSLAPVFARAVEGYSAYLHTTVAKAVLLNYTAPVYVTLLGPWLLGERRSRWAWPAVALGFGGIVLIADPTQLGSFSASELSGILAAAVSGISFAGVFMISRYLAQHVAATARVLAGAVVMIVMFVPWGLMTPPELFWRNLPFVAGLGLFALGLPYLFIFAGQKHVTAQVGSMVALFEPVCVVIIGYLVYAERLTALGMIGAAAILVSIYLTSQ
jgi:drug/metabolite transporter (DMT)-like permease